MTINEFIKLTKDEPNKWIRYCEIIIIENGDVILARPSHEQAIVKYIADKYGITDDDIRYALPLHYDFMTFACEYENIVSVWYDCLIVSSNINNAQVDSIKILMDNNLISKNINYRNATEYSHYCKFYNCKCDFSWKNRDSSYEN